MFDFGLLVKDLVLMLVVSVVGAGAVWWVAHRGLEERVGYGRCLLASILARGVTFIAAYGVFSALGKMHHEWAWVAAGTELALAFPAYLLFYSLMLRDRRNDAIGFNAGFALTIVIYLFALGAKAAFFVLDGGLGAAFN